MQRIIDVDEKLPILETLPLSFQHLMAMFGGTVLVPLILKIDPAIVLLMNGIGTLIYSLVTRAKVPAYLGSSFAFLAPAILIISRSGFNHAQSGFIFFGLFFIVTAIIIRLVGIKWLEIIFPTPVMGAVVAVIGLELAPTACGMAGVCVPGPDPDTVVIALFTLFVGVLGSLSFRGFLQSVPVLIAIIAGYLLALSMGKVDFTPVMKAAWFSFPKFSAPVFDASAIINITPACFVVLAEHIGHLMVTGNIVGRDLIKDPGLHTSLLGDGISNFLSGFTGSTPNTTYGENIGVMAITRVYSVWVIRVAAVVSIVIACFGKFSALVQTIPESVMGGICMLLFGVIAVAGIRILIEQKVDYSKNYNMVLSSIVFVVGVSGAKIFLGPVEIKGMALSAFIGIALSIIAYLLSKVGMLNEKIEVSRH